LPYIQVKPGSPTFCGNVKHNSTINSICNDRLNITLYNVYEHVTEDLEGRSVNEIIDKGVSAIIKDKCECTTVSLLIVDAKAKTPWNTYEQAKTDECKS
jgi:hypothetical protein